MTILQQFNITTIAVVELDTSAGASAYSLPDITPFQQGIWVKDATGNAAPNNVTISHSALLIDGSATYILKIPYQSALFISDGARISVHDGRGISTLELTDSIPFGTWAPTDASGAGLVFTSVSAQAGKIGNLVYAYGTLTYPVTANGNNAAITLPIAVPNQAYAVVPGSAGANAGPAGLYLRSVQNASSATFRVTPGGAVTNATLSAAVIAFMLIYPAS